MENTNFYETICVSKLFSVAVCGDQRTSLSDIECKTALEALKKMADDKWDWSQEQKDFYKSMVDYTKEIFSRRKAVD